MTHVLSCNGELTEAAFDAAELVHGSVAVGTVARVHPIWMTLSWLEAGTMLWLPTERIDDGNVYRA